MPAESQPGGSQVIGRAQGVHLAALVSQWCGWVRDETPPGQQGPADWVWCGRLADGTPVYAVLLGLGFSRLLAVGLSTDRRLCAWRR